MSAQDLDGADELAAQAEPLTPSPLRGLALGLLARERGRVGEAKTYLREALTRAPGAPDDSVHQRAAVGAAGLHTRLTEGALAIEALDTVDDIADCPACDMSQPQPRHH